MRPAKPIKIAPSNASNVTKYDLGDSAYSSSDEIMLDGHTDGENRFIIGNNRCDDLNSGVGGMTIGSLPSVRRGRRSVVTSGGNEMMFGSIGNRWTQNQQQYNDRPNREMLASSMPVPHAPFLSSRRDYEIGNNISSIPSINLTRSAAESIETDSVPYGSLRESAFTRMNPNSFNRTACLSDFTCNESSVDDKSSNGFIPLSLPPTHLSNGLDVKTNGIGTENCGGIASLLDGDDSASIQMGNGALTTNEDLRCLRGSSNIDIGVSSSDHIGQGEFKEDNRDHFANNSGEYRLGTSLTGLDILRSSQSGLVDLTREQKENLQNRVKDMGSYDALVSRSLSTPHAHISSENPLTHRNVRTISSDTQSPQPSFLIPPRNMRQTHDIVDPEGYDDRPPPPILSPQTSYLIPPRNMIQDHEPEDSDSYDNDDIFDMDE